MYIAVCIYFQSTVLPQQRLSNSLFKVFNAFEPVDSLSRSLWATNSSVLSNPRPTHK